MRPIHLTGLGSPEIVETRSPIRRSSIERSPCRVRICVPLEKQWAPPPPPLGPPPLGLPGCATALPEANSLARTNPPTALTPYIMCRRDETKSGRDFENTLIQRKSTLLITLNLPAPL